MTVTDELLENNESYSSSFTKGDLPMPPAKKVAVVAYTGQKPAWASETFSDLDEDVKQSMNRIRSSPFVPRKDNVRGFVYEVETGRLREVS